MEFTDGYSGEFADLITTPFYTVGALEFETVTMWCWAVHHII